MGRDRNNMSKLAKLDSIKLFFISYYVHIYALEFIYENKNEVVPSIFSLIRNQFINIVVDRLEEGLPVIQTEYYQQMLFKFMLRVDTSYSS